MSLDPRDMPPTRALALPAEEYSPQQILVQESISESERKPTVIPLLSSKAS